MKYNELQINANKSRKRVGRGIAAGQGKTAGRGTKGQGARTGKKLGHGFMGGQGPLVQRIPKARGFKSLRVPAQVVYTAQLNEVKATSIDNKVLYEAGLVATPYHTVKVILRGEYKGKATIKVQAMSANAEAMVKKAGGAFEPTDAPKLPASNKARETKRTERKEKAEKKASK